MKFILDVGVGKKVENYLRNEGYEVISILDKDHSMKDEAILDIAVQAGGMVITMDKDFGELVYRDKRVHNGVLLLRLEDATGQEKVEVIKLILQNHINELEDNFCVYQNNKLRVSKP